MFSSATKSGGLGGYPLTKSLRFRASASANMTRTPASASNRQKWTWSGWVKRGTLSTSQTLFGCQLGNAGVVRAGIQIVSDQLNFFSDPTGSTGTTLQSTNVLRDCSAWYHIVVVADVAQATAANRLLMYINGVQITSFSTANYPVQNTNMAINSTSQHQIGSSAASTNYLDGYLSENYFVDGQALTPSSFGSTNNTTGVWQPKPYTGTYGTNGFYLPFTNITSTTTLGNDSSGNGNNWTPNNFSLTAGATYDSMTDVPTLTSASVANYATLNPLNKSSGDTLGNGNLSITASSVAGYSSDPATIGVTSGKWYWEVTAQSDPGVGIGIMTDLQPLTNYLGQTSGVGFFNSGNIFKDGVNVQPAVAPFTTGDVVAAALNLDAGTIQFYKNNVAAGTAVSISYGRTIYPACGDGSAGIAGLMSINFGQQGFKYTPPSGYNPLNTFNLANSTIVAGNKYMDATLYSGNSSTQSITNAASFQPDLVWIKSRSAATDNKLTDSVRSATKALISNTTGAETTDSTGLTAFNSNGFTLGSSTVYNNGTGPATYVAWQWQAAQGSTSSNTSGSITSTVSVNATAGFSIVTYTGTGANATVGHGLGVVPKLIIVKNRSTTTSWPVYHSSLANTQYLYLNAVDAVASSATIWNNTTPTSSVFSIGTNAGVNGNTNSMVAYCWTDIAGYSQFGSYSGNANADGPFIYCGFRPKFILFKNTADNTTNWRIYDTARSPYNLTQLELLPNQNSAESTGGGIDILSNGFKVRTTGAAYNGSGNTIIYAAFAENPFKYALAR